MRRRISIILGIIWMITAALAVFVPAVSVVGELPDFMSVAGSLESGSSFADLNRSDEMYGLLLLSSSDAQTDRYRIAEISESGQMISRTSVIEVPKDLELSNFIAAPEGFYLTFITDGNQSAQAWFVQNDELIKASVSEGDPIEMELADSLTLTDGSQINWASYEEERFLVWGSDGSGAQYYEQNVYEDELCEQFLMDAGERGRVRMYHFAWFAGIVIAGWVLIGVFMYLLRDRNSTIYLIALVEAILFIVIFAGTALTVWSHNKASEEEARRFAGYYMDVILESADGDYTDAQDLILAFSESEAVSDSFKDLCVVDTSDHRILESAGGMSGVGLEDLYGNENLYVWADADDTSDWTVVIVLNPGRGIFRSSFTLICIVTALILFIIGTAVCLILLLNRERDMRSFKKALCEVSSGKECRINGHSHTKDMSTLWNGLMEIQKNIHRMDYDRYQIYESCYRFAPKNIEKIFGKDSITEVLSGDTSILDGTIAFVTFDEPSYLDEEASAQINRFVSAVEKYQDENGGFFISGCSDLTGLKILFPDGSGRGTEFGTGFLNTFYSVKSTGRGKSGILLHYSRFLYGVAGNESQSFPFLLLDEKEELERYAVWFGSMNIRMVMTHEVLKNEDYQGSVRYIGYLLFDNGKKLDLYEALDVCQAWERRLKLDTDEKFQKALLLFYRHDFYLARSGFSDVLKENAADQIAKWYLFTCEKYLNESYCEGDICRLQI